MGGHGHRTRSSRCLRGTQLHGGPCFGFFEGISEASFDVVTVSHVVEYVHHPAALLQQCQRALVPGGELWLATPNLQSSGLKVFKRAWQPLEIPRHLVVPSASGLRRMLLEAGFGDVTSLRRGHGSFKRLRAISRRACDMGMGAWPPWLLSPFIDLLSSLSAFGGEELLVRARKNG